MYSGLGVVMLWGLMGYAAGRLISTGFDRRKHGESATLPFLVALILLVGIGWLFYRAGP